MLLFAEDNAIAEPTVSISPFIPVSTGTAPLEQCLFIQASSLAIKADISWLCSEVTEIPLELSLILHMKIQVLFHVSQSESCVPLVIQYLSTELHEEIFYLKLR